MDLADLISRLALALGIGLLLGLERGWRRRGAPPGGRAAGIRTFAISALLGGVSAALAQAAGGVAGAGGGLLLGSALIVYSLAIVLFCRDENAAVGVYSATTAIAGILTFVLGAYAVLGDMRVAAAVAVASAGLLALREELHGWVEKITWPELRSGLVLLAMSFIALPIMPDDPIGPFGGVNLREVWIIAIVLAGVSFLGYAAVKYFGVRRGMLLAAAAGGLASSTAVTIANARRAAAGEGAPRLLAAGVAVASVIMFLRVVGVVAALNPVLLVLIAPALLAATATAVAFASVWMLRLKGREDYRGAEFRNPFDFRSVVGFALFLGAIIVFGRLLGEKFGATGAVAGAAVVGLAEVDAITVSISQLVPDTLTRADAALAILAAVATNTVSKVAIGAMIGRGWFALALAALAAGCLAVGALALALSFAVLGP